MKIFRSSVALPVLLAATAAIVPRLALAGGPAGTVSAPQAAAAGEANPGNAAPAPKIDDAAMALLLKAQTAMSNLKTYRAEDRMLLKIASGPDGKPQPPSASLSTVTFSKPNLMRLDRYTLTADAGGELTKKSDTATLTVVSDGKDMWMQSGKTYRTNPLKSPAQLLSFSGPSSGFYAEQSSPYGEADAAKKHGALVEVRGLGTESFAGVECQKVLVHEKHISGSSEYETQTTWYFGPDNLVRRHLQSFSSKQMSYTIEQSLSNIKTDDSLAAATTLFAYTPPAGVTLFVPKPQPVLLANGVAAPDFTAVDSTGATVKLSDFKGKVVVVDFWANWCPPCKASMPHNQEVTKKLQAANVPMILLAVDNSESGADADTRHEAYVAWVKSHPEFDALKFVYVDPMVHSVCNDDYHVSGIPTQYVIDPQGIIRASFVGYGGPTDDMENAVRAAVVKTASK